MKRSTPFAASAILLALALAPAACRGKVSPQAAASPAGSPDVVATIDGAPVLAAELDQQVEKRLMRVRQEEYEIRRAALDEIIGQRLLEKEAARRGVSKEEVLRDEVDNQVADPDPALMEQIYKHNQERFGTKTKEQALAEIRKMMRERAAAERRVAFQGLLREKAKVQVALQAPRTNMPVPMNAPSLGPADAPITIVEFSDYQCPFCHRAQATIDTVMSRYAGKVQLVHRDFPLDGHPQAIPASRAARCAGEQGKFWDYHRSLMTVRGSMDDADFKGRAADLKLDTAAFGACLASDRHDAAIRESTEAGIQAGVTGTPAYFVNGRLISGARPFEAFQEIIDAELSRAS